MHHHTRSGKLKTVPLTRSMDPLDHQTATNSIYRREVIPFWSFLCWRLKKRSPFGKDQEQPRVSQRRNTSNGDPHEGWRKKPPRKTADNGLVLVKDQNPRGKAQGRRENVFLFTSLVKNVAASLWGWDEAYLKPKILRMTIMPLINEGGS